MFGDRCPQMRHRLAVLNSLVARALLVALADLAPPAAPVDLERPAGLARLVDPVRPATRVVPADLGALPDIDGMVILKSTNLVGARSPDHKSLCLC
jgi:hypothetical protein